MIDPMFSRRHNETPVIGQFYTANKVDDSLGRLKVALHKSNIKKALEQELGLRSVEITKGRDSRFSLPVPEFSDESIQEIFFDVGSAQLPFDALRKNYSALRDRVDVAVAMKQQGWSAEYDPITFKTVGGLLNEEGTVRFEGNKVTGKNNNVEFSLHNLSRKFALSESLPATSALLSTPLMDAEKPATVRLIARQYDKDDRELSLRFSHDHSSITVSPLRLHQGKSGVSEGTLFNLIGVNGLSPEYLYVDFFERVKHLQKDVNPDMFDSAVRLYETGDKNALGRDMNPLEKLAYEAHQQSVLLRAVNEYVDLNRPVDVGRTMEQMAQKSHFNDTSIADCVVYKKKDF
jgi:hypothetical protein